MKSRIISTMVALAAIVGGAQAQTLSVQPTEAQTGEQTELVVSLTGGTAMTALQFNLQLPEGVTLDETAIAKGEAAGGHTLSISTLDGGDRLFVLYSMNLDTFGDGCLLRLPVTAPHGGRDVQRTALHRAHGQRRRRGGREPYGGGCRLHGDGATGGRALEENTSLWCIWDNFRLTYYGPDARLQDVKPDDSTGIILTDNGSLTNSDGFYDLNGRRLAGKPAKKGIYVKNGKKVVIR